MGRGEAGDPGPDDDDVRMVRGLLSTCPSPRSARLVGRSCPRQAPGIPEFGPRLGSGRPNRRVAHAAEHGRTAVAHGAPGATPVATVGAAIERPAPAPARTQRRADRLVDAGNANAKPDSSSRVGSTRWLPSTSPANSPSAIRSAGRGHRRTASGRCSTRPMAAVTSRLVTGSGAGEVDRPRQRRRCRGGAAARRPRRAAR